MTRTHIIAALLVVAMACAGLKTVLRTADDIATDLCMLFATDNAEDLAERYSMSPREWCAVKDNFQPFIDDVLKLRREQGIEMGARINGTPAE